MFLNIDLGTTSVKISLVDQDGRLIALSIQEYRLDIDESNHIELDPEIYWACCKRGISRVITHLSTSSPRIASIGVCSQGETLIVLGGNNKPLRKAIVWYDKRSVHEAEELRTNVGENLFTGQTAIDACWPVTKILWIKHHEPDVFREAVKYMLVTDYIVFRLTGNFYADRSVYSSSYMLDIHSGVWLEKVLNYVGVATDQLPCLCDPGSIVGNIQNSVAYELDLPRSIVVVSGGLDQMAALVGSGNITNGCVTETTGAALTVCRTISTFNPDYARLRPVHIHAAVHSYALMDWCPVGGMALKWFRDTFYPKENVTYDGLIQLAQNVTPGSNGLSFFPFMEGLGTVRANKKNSGGILAGLGLKHGKSHIIRAIVEGLGFMVRYFIEEMETDQFGDSFRDKIVAPVRTLGGSARDPVWVQMKADATRRQMWIMECQESASLGLAILQATALGFYPDISSAIRNMVRIVREVTPNIINGEEYENLYSTYVSAMKQYLA